MAIIQAITHDELQEHVQAAKSELTSKIQALRQELDQLKKAQKPNEYLTVNETAKHIGVTPFTVRKYTKSGILTRYMIGSRIRYKRHEVDAALLLIRVPKRV